MPLYEYECDACGQRFELIRKFSDPPVEVCARCGKGPVRRQVSTPAIQFKGSGWYITDYARKGSGGTEKPAGEKPTGEKSSDSKSDSAAKPEAAAKSDSGTAKKSDSGTTKS